MSRFQIFATVTFALAAAPAVAGSHLSAEAAYGEENFGKCATCHVIVDDAGEKIAGRNGKTGPNLHCMVGQQAGTVDGFRYGDDLRAAGEAGLVWSTEEMAAYLQDPRGYLRAYLDDPKARSKMSYKTRADGDLSAAEVAQRFAAFIAESCAETPGG